MTNESRFRVAENVTIWSIVLNILLVIVKWVVGILGQSKALVADAVHSLADTIASIAVLIGLRAARQPADKEHPYGHGKAESVSAIIVSVIIIIAGIEIVRNSLASFFEPSSFPKLFTLWVLIPDIMIKEAMFQYKFRLGKKMNSQALIVNAYEHRSDVLSSIAATAGILVAILGGHLGIPFFAYADPIAGLFVAGLIIHMGWHLGKESILLTIDQVLSEEETRTFIQRIENVKGVRSIDQLLARKHGYYVIIDLKIGVDPYLTVEEGHRIGKNVKNKLLELDIVEDVKVHINPSS